MQKELRHVNGRVIIKADLQSKNSHRFADGTVIRLERQYDNFNRRHTEPTNAIVISADNIPSGSEILISHNALHEVNKINNYKNLSGAEESSNIKYYSLPESDCFAWRDESGELQPMKGFCFAMRVFEPYKGFLVGIEPKIIPNVLYIMTGRLKGNVCHTVKAADYTIVFQDTNGREGNVIRCRHFEDEINDREEILAVSHSLTKRISDGDFLVGINVEDAKHIN